MSGEKNVFVITEQTGGQLKDISYEVLSYGRQLVSTLGGQVCALIIGCDCQEPAKTLASYGADSVYLLHNPVIQDYQAEFYIETLSKLCEDDKPEVVIGGATLAGRDLASRLAARLETGLLSECISLEINPENRLQATRLTHGGRIKSTVVCTPSSKPQIATVKPGTIAAARPVPGREAKVTVIVPEPGEREPRQHVIGTYKAEPEKIALDEADVIVACGKGVVGPGNVKLLEELAGLMGGVVAGSLGAVDEGWLPRRKLVGQTGKTVAPRLYIACGISGSVYHVLGMKESEWVIAINKDRNAPIFKIADVGIIGDVREVTSAMIRCLRGLSPNTTMDR